MAKRSAKRMVAVVVILAVLAAVGVILWLVLSPKEEQTSMKLVRQDDPALAPGTVCYVIQGGLDWEADLPRPMPCYGFTMPEGYTHVVNAEESANRLSLSYQDQYQTPQGILTFTQSPAYFDWSRSGIGTFWEVQYGDARVVCQMGEDYSGAYWLHENTVLEFTADWAMEQNQLLDLVRRVDYSVNRTPIYSPLEFQAISAGGQYTYSITGNPQLPESRMYYDFSQTPQELAAAPADEQTYLGTYSYFTVASTRDGRKDTLEVRNYASGDSLFDWAADDQAPPSPDTVEQVTVGGKPGLFYRSGNVLELVWLEDSQGVGITYTARIGAGSLEQLLEYAEQLVEKHPAST